MQLIFTALKNSNPEGYLACGKLTNCKFQCATIYVSFSLTLWLPQSTTNFCFQNYLFSRLEPVPKYAEKRYKSLFCSGRKGVKGFQGINYLLLQ